MVSYIELTQGLEGVGLNTQQRDEGRERQQAQAQRRLAAAEGLPANLRGSAATMLMNGGIAQANAAGGMSKQAADVAERTGGFGQEQMIAQESATETGQQTYSNLSAVESTAMSTRLG